MKQCYKLSSRVWKAWVRRQESRPSNSSSTAGEEQFSHVELKLERLEFHRSRFEEGEGEKEEKKRKRRFGSKEEEEDDMVKKTGSEEEDL